MRDDLAARLRRSMKGEPIRGSTLTMDMGVTGTAVTCDKSLKLQMLRRLRLESDKVANDVSDGIAASPEPDETEIDGREGMASSGVQEPYIDALARLQFQRPMAVSDADWRLAIDAAGRFLEAWGKFRWTPGNLFDKTHDGKTGGLIWFLNGEDVRALGPEHGVTLSGRVFDRMTRAEWINAGSRL